MTGKPQTKLLSCTDLEVRLVGASLVDVDGWVSFSPSKLSLLACPRQGQARLAEATDGTSSALVVGSAAHSVLARLAQGDWPSVAPEELVDLVERGLHAEWRRSGLPTDGYDEAREGLIGLLAGFLDRWRPPRGVKAYPEVSARLEDRDEKIRLFGRLDLLIPPGASSSGTTEDTVVFDWKSGSRPFEDEEEPPLAVVAQGALARARIGAICRGIVRWVYLKTVDEQSWVFDQRELVDGWSRVREVAADVRADRWPPRPGRWCQWCSVVRCEFAVSTTDVAELGLV